MIQAIGLTSQAHRDLPLVVDDVSFEAPPGRVTVLYGARGSGKSSTLRLMLQMQRGRGVALFRGRPLHRLPHPAREVGVILGDVPGHPGRSARGHLRMLSAAVGVPAERAEDVLDIVGLSGLADHRLGGFSCGMDRRLGLAAALLGDPHTLVLDEPAEGLSPREAAWLTGLLRRFAEQGGAVLVTSQDAREAARLADRVVVLQEGRLVADQEAAEFARTRLRPRVAVRSPQAERLAALLVDESQRAHPAHASSLEVVRESGTRIAVYGSSCAAVGDAAFRHGILVHQLSDEVGNSATVRPLERADGRRPLPPTRELPVVTPPGVSPEAEPGPVTTSPAVTAAVRPRAIGAPVVVRRALAGAGAGEFDRSRSIREQHTGEVGAGRVPSAATGAGTVAGAGSDHAVRVADTSGTGSHSSEELPRLGRGRDGAGTATDPADASRKRAEAGSQDGAVSGGVLDERLDRSSPRGERGGVRSGGIAGGGVIEATVVAPSDARQNAAMAQLTPVPADPRRRDSPTSQAEQEAFPAPAAAPVDEQEQIPSRLPPPTPNSIFRPLPSDVTGAGRTHTTPEPPPTPRRPAVDRRPAPGAPRDEARHHPQASGGATPAFASMSSQTETGHAGGHGGPTAVTASEPRTARSRPIAGLRRRGSARRHTASATDEALGHRADPAGRRPTAAGTAATCLAEAEATGSTGPTGTGAGTGTAVMPLVGTERALARREGEDGVGRAAIVRRAAPGPAWPVRYEVRRVSSDRAAAVAVALTLALSVALALWGARTGGVPAMRVLTAWPHRLPLPPAAFGAGLVGALAYGQEFRYPALAPAQGTVPRRLRLLAAKLLVGAGLSGLLASVVLALDSAAVRLVFGSHALALPADRLALTGGWAALVIGCAWTGALGAAVFRSTAAGFCSVVVVPLLGALVARHVMDAPTAQALAGFRERLRHAAHLRWPGAEEPLAVVLRFLGRPTGAAFATAVVILVFLFAVTGARGRARTR